MPAADDGEWNSSCSNVVCVRTKSSKESENSEDVPVINILPTVVRSFYRNELSAAPPPQPPRTTQRRRITRLIETTPLTPTSPVHYEGVNKVSINLKTPITASVYNGPDWRPPSFSPSRRSIAVRKSFDPPKFSYDLPEVTLPPTSGRHFRPVSLAPITTRSSSVPPLVSTPYLRRASISVPSYSTYSSGLTGRQFGRAGTVTSSLRRGSVDSSCLSRIPDSYKSISGISSVRPSVPSSGLRNTYRRGSLSVLGTTDRSTYRSSTAGRLIEDEFRSAPLSATSDIFSSLRSRTQQARDKLDTHRSLTDRYLTGGGSRAPSVDSRFGYQTDRNSELESFSRRASISSLPRSTSAGSRAPSMERSDFTPVSRASAPPPSMPEMSPARRRIRSVLYKVSGDQEYLK